MRTAYTSTLSLVLALATAAACKSSPEIDDSFLVYVPEEARSELDELRTERARLSDEVAAAQNGIDLEEERARIAGEELDLAQDEVEIYEARARAARTNPEREAKEFDEDLQTARTHVNWAQAQVDYRKALVEVAQAEHDLAQRRVELADARIELRKARAVSELEDDRVPEIEIERFQQALDAAETRVEMAKIDVEAAQRRAGAREDVMTRIADRVPQPEAASWRRVDGGNVREAASGEEGRGDDLEPRDDQPRR